MTETEFSLSSMAPPRRRRRGALIGAIVACALVLVAGTVAATMWLTRGSSAPAPASASPGTLSATGTLRLSRGTFAWSSSGKSCTGHRGYDDIQPGAQVVITDSAGKTVGVGQLGYGDPGGATSNTCTFPFKVAVPSGLGFYGVEVSHRGKVQYPEADLVAGVAISLGG